MVRSASVKTTLALAAVIAAFGSSAQAHQQIEVLHFWTSGGEAAALNVLKQKVEAQGIVWKDMPVAGGGGEQAMTTLRTRISSGIPPTAVLLMGFDLTDWARQGVLADLNAQAQLASDIMDPGVQSTFNVLKGSVPARSDVSNKDFDACGKRDMAELALATKNNTLVGSIAHGHAVASSVKNAFYDVITRHFNGQLDDKKAVAALVAATRQ